MVMEYTAETIGFPAIDFLDPEQNPDGFRIARVTLTSHKKFETKFEDMEE